MKIKTIQSEKLKAADYNPKKISEEKLNKLKKAYIDEFGDLGGIVINIRTGNTISGHQRIKVIPENATIEIIKQYDKATRTGTIAEGFIIIDNERYFYRKVDWSLEKEKLANLAANHLKGEDDDILLEKLLRELSTSKEIDISLSGFDEKEIDDILNSFDEEENKIKNWEMDEIYIPFWIVIRGPIENIGAIKEALNKIKNIQGIKIEASA